MTKLTATLAGPHAGDVLAASTTGTSITASFAGGTLTLSGSDTLAHYQQVLRTIAYNNTAGGPGVSSETVNVVATDNGSLVSSTAVATIDIDVDPPVVTMVPSSIAWSTASGALTIGPGSTITDGDSSNSQGVEIDLNDMGITTDVLSVPSGNSGQTIPGTNITATFTPATSGASADLVLLGLDTFANYQAALRTVTYDNTGGGPGVGSLTVTVFTVDDGNLQSQNATETINIDSAAPVVDLNNPSTGFTTLWSTATGPVNLANGANGTIADADSVNLTKLTATLASPHAGDELAANVSGTSITASFAGGSLTLSGSDTLAHYQQVLRAITYNNTAGGPGVASETVNVVATDDGSLASSTVVATINIDAAAPVVDLNGPAAGTGNTSTWTNAGPVNITTIDATVTDPDSSSLNKLTATITSPAAGDVLSANTTGTSITASFSAGVLTLSGSDTPVHYQQVLESITYNNTAGGPGVASETVNAVAADDGNLVSNVAIATINTGFSSSVANRSLFYKGSPRYDLAGGSNGQTPLPFSDDNAIASDKGAYLPGSGAATFANVSSYTLGINGLMVDLSGTHGTISANDFIFKTGNNNSPSTWTTVAATVTVTTRPGAGTGGSDRIEIAFPNNAIQMTWLEVIVKGNDTLGGNNTSTGLAASDVFFWGSAVGDDGTTPDDATTFRTDAADELDARNNPASLPANIPITNIYDFNRDGKVSATDQLASRDNADTNLTAPKMINISGAGPFAPDAAPAAVPSTAPAASPTASSTASVSVDAALASGIASLLGSLPPNLPSGLQDRLQNNLDSLPLVTTFQGRERDSPVSRQLQQAIDHVADKYKLYDDVLDGILVDMGLE